MRIKQIAIAIALSLAIAPAHAEEAIYSLTTGVEATTGTYGGTTSTNVIYVPVTGKVQFDYLFLKLTVPYISVSSAGNVVRGMGRVKSTKTTTTVTTESGLGDIVASAGYIVFEDDDWMFDVAGNVKFGTADASKNLGTGVNDYSTQVDGFYTLRKTTFFGTVGYKIIGAPAGVSVNNIFYGTIGASRKISEKTKVEAMLDVAQSTNAYSDGIRELGIYLSHKVSKTLKVQVGVLKGFSDSSPDAGASGMITGTFD